MRLNVPELLAVAGYKSIPLPLDFVVEQLFRVGERVHSWIVKLRVQCFNDFAQTRQRIRIIELVEDVFFNVAQKAVQIFKEDIQLARDLLLNQLWLELFNVLEHLLEINES